MEVCCFPMIMSFHKCFKDDFNIYFVNEFINGIELFNVLR